MSRSSILATIFICLPLSVVNGLCTLPTIAGLAEWLDIFDVAGATEQDRDNMVGLQVITVRSRPDALVVALRTEGLPLFGGVGPTVASLQGAVLVDTSGLSVWICGGPLLGTLKALRGIGRIPLACSQPSLVCVICVPLSLILAPSFSVCITIPAILLSLLLLVRCPPLSTAFSPPGFSFLVAEFLPHGFS
jgi:hypothetical protein